MPLICNDGDHFTLESIVEIEDNFVFSCFKSILHIFLCVNLARNVFSKIIYLTDYYVIFRNP